MCLSVSHIPVLYQNEKLCHDMPLIEINNVVDDGVLFIAPFMVDDIQGLRLVLHQFDLSLYLLPTWLNNISTTNQPSGV